MTSLNLTLSFLVVVGACLVAQPTFIFGDDDSDSSRRDYQDYTLGVVLSTILSFITGVAPIIQSKCKDMPISYFMLWSGLAKLVVGLLCPMFGVSNHLGDMTRLRSDAPTLTLISGASMLGAMFTQLAVTVSNAPILVSVTRSMEIVMALFLDTVIAPSGSIDYTSLSFVYKILGSLVVFMCVVGIAIHDTIIDNGWEIMKQALKFICKKGNSSYEQQMDQQSEQRVEGTESLLSDNRPNGNYGTTHN